jgi:hypothetical protein
MLFRGQIIRSRGEFQAGKQLEFIARKRLFRKTVRAWLLQGYENKLRHDTMIEFVDWEDFENSFDGLIFKPE